MLFFIIPAKPDFIHIFSNDETKRPKTPSPALLTWKIVQQKLPWGLIFLLGGGFALAEGSKASGMNHFIVHYLGSVIFLPRLAIMVIACLLACLLTQFSSNIAVCNVILPVLAEISEVSVFGHPETLKNN